MIEFLGFLTMHDIIELHGFTSMNDTVTPEQSLDFVNFIVTWLYVYMPHGQKCLVFFKLMIFLSMPHILQYRGMLGIIELLSYLNIPQYVKGLCTIEFVGFYDLIDIPGASINVWECLQLVFS